MSRSLHETRRMIQDTRREDWCDHEEHENHLTGLRMKLDRKRCIKHQIVDERKGLCTIRSEEEFTITTDPTGIPIIVKDNSTLIHFPATPADLHAVMQRLPPGVCDGISQIELCLGEHDPPSDDAILFEHKPDPYTGRISGQLLPDVWMKSPLGCYHQATASICLYAYVYPPNIKNLPNKEFLLKLHVLSTFVHEIAHHHDYTRRNARGRWLPDDDRKKEEDYADEIEHDWLHQVVVPYLLESYSTESLRFIEWVEYYGGARLTLDQMAGDPRKCIGNIQDILFFLFQWVEEGKELIESRTEFADFLHMCAFYEEALGVVEQILTEEPEDLEALRLKAHILAEQKNYSEARELALHIIKMDPDYTDAWCELCYACEGLGLWEEVITATTREIDLLPPGHWQATVTLQPRIRARIALGDLTDAEIDIQLLEHSSSPMHQKRAETYRMQLDQAKAMEEHHG